jgi:hypothetical protein
MWDGQRRDGGTSSTSRIKEQEKHLTFNEHDDDDDDGINALRTDGAPRPATYEERKVPKVCRCSHRRSELGSRIRN